MEPIGEILKIQEDLKTGHLYLWANDINLSKYEHEIPPEPIICEFCNKKLYYKGLIHPFKTKTIFKWICPEPCNCEKSIEYRKRKEEERIKQEEAKREAIRKQEEKIKIERLFQMSKMGARFKDRSFDNFIVNKQNENAYKIAKAFSDNFDKAKESGLGIMFVGNYGAGKTHLACSIAIELMNKSVPVIYGSSISLLGKIKQAYNETTTTDEWQLLELYSTTDLLIIDDLGKERPSEWVLEKLYYIINQRYENLKPTIITTNYDDITLISRLSTKSNSSTAEAIVSRLNEMCTGVYMNFEDYRKK